MGPYDDDYADDYDDSMNYYDDTMEDLIASEYNYGNSDNETVHRKLRALALR